MYNKEIRQRAKLCTQNCFIDLNEKTGKTIGAGLQNYCESRFILLKKS